MDAIGIAVGTVENPMDAISIAVGIGILSIYIALAFFIFGLTREKPLRKEKREKRSSLGNALTKINAPTGGVFSWSGTMKRICDHCNGRGVYSEGLGSTARYVACPKCRGKRYIEAIMNLTNLAAVLREDMTTIKVRHIDRNSSSGDLTKKLYTYKCKRDVAKTLKQDDIVAVNANASMNYCNVAIAVVDNVDEEPDIDLYNGKTLKWVICKIDIQEAINRQLDDDSVGGKLRVQKAKNCREQALSMLGLSQEDAKKLLR